jgi:hypothetical protein
MISREDRIIPRLEFIEYVYKNHPQVVIEFNNSRGLNQSPTADADTNSSFGKQRGDDIPQSQAQIKILLTIKITYEIFGSKVRGPILTAKMLLLISGIEGLNIASHDT